MKIFTHIPLKKQTKQQQKKITKHKITSGSLFRKYQKIRKNVLLRVVPLLAKNKIMRRKKDKKARKKTKELLS